MDYEDDRKCFCFNLKKYRKRMQYTQEELAILCGLHRTYISALERGHANPTLDTIVLLAQVLQIDACYLLLQAQHTSNYRD